MKVNNLLKKVGSVITTVALLATLGTTAFADAPEKYTDSKEGTGIKITNVKTEQVGTSDIYKVTVDYYTTVDNLTGMTMMMYTKNDINDPSSLEKPSYEASMKIVGIDQQAGKKGATGTAADDADKKGSFVFNITTNESGSNGYYVKKGVPALIAVSGDQCTPAYALCGVSRTAGYAVPITLKDTEKDAVDIAVNENIGAKLSEKAKGMSVSLKESENPLDVIGGVTLPEIPANSWQKKDSTNLYEAEVTLHSGLDASSLCEIPEGLKVKVSATVEFTPAEATSVTKFNGASVDTASKKFILNIKDSELTGKEPEKQKEYFISKIKGGTATITAPAEGKDGVAVSGDVKIMDGFDVTNGESDEAEKTYDYMVTIPKGNYKADGEAYPSDNTLLTVGEKKLPFTVQIKVTSKTAIKNVVGSGVVEKETITMSDISDEDSIKAELNKLIVSNAPLTCTVEGAGTAPENVTLADFEYGWSIENGTDSNTKTAKLTITNIKNSDLAETYVLEGTPVLATVKVTKEEAPAYTFGDVNGDGTIDISDYGLIKRYSLHKINEFTAADGSIIPKEAADVSGDGTIDISDYDLIKRYSLHKISSFPAEEGK